ncbi:unnamed protein product [Caenorhabditis brenneri]
MNEANLREYNGYVKAISKELGEEPIPVENDDEANLCKFPPELLAKVFSLVGSKNFNPAPPNFVKYIDAKGARDFRKKCENNIGHRTYNDIDNQAQWDYIEERESWTEKVKEEYPIRNLMLLRRVCTKFESVINNEMTPGKDFDFLMVDVRLQGQLMETDIGNPSRQVTFFKYGGNGSLNPAIRLARVRRFNEVDYEHIQKFERIRDLHISDMMLTEELFETILRLDLTLARRITFERIVGVKFDESINVVNYIQDFLETLNTPANVYFNSEMFDPNVVLFGLKDDEVEPVTDETVLLDMKVIETVNEKRTSGRRAYRNSVKNYQKPKESDFQFRRYKLIKMINTILFNEPHAKMFKLKELSYKSRRAFFTLKKTMMDTLKYKLRRRSDGVKKAGEWHLQQAIEILERKKKNGKDTKSAMFHLKILKQIVESDKLSEKEEESIVHTMKETQNYNDSMGEFQFMSKFQMKTRIYCPRSENL